MRLLALFAALMTLLAACGGGEDPDADSSTSALGGSTTTMSVETSVPVETTTTTTVGATTTVGPQQAVTVVFGSADQSDCSNVAAVERSIGAEAEPILGAFEELLVGPTSQEEEGGSVSMFSAETAGMVLSASLENGDLTVDFEDFSGIIPNASTSCGSASLIAQLNGTAFQFPEVESVTYTFGGACEPFFNWLQRDCQVYDNETGTGS